MSCTIAAATVHAQPPEVDALRAKVETQDATIAELRAEIDEMKPLVGTRFATVEARSERGKAVYPQPSARIESERGCRRRQPHQHRPRRGVKLNILGLRVHQKF